MNITAIVAEYNPFHNGHLYQINKIKRDLKSDYIIAIMSGNFSQRGTPCIVDKFIRTKMALSQGVDLVIELPITFATASAETFARGAITTLYHTRIIDNLCFGCEEDNLLVLSGIASVLSKEPPEYKALLKSYLKMGLSYPTARHKALNNFGEFPQEVLSSPNNILAIEYIKALYQLGSNITPFPIKREVSNFHDTHVHSSIASATALRIAMLNGEKSDMKLAMPSTSLKLLEAVETFPDIEKLFYLLHYQLLITKKHELYNIWDVPEKLVNSLYNNFSNSTSYTQLVDMLTSKTYTRSTVYRSLLRILLGITAPPTVTYIRVLGCRQKSIRLLSLLSSKADLPVLTSKPYSSTDIFATNLYQLLRSSPNLYNQDYTQSLILI
ncbi:MAG: hypothetical protein ATN34_04625 [Epulopiscium sp. Nele67-Bin002]|nr:MAG: hypothetical protein BEN18_08005 [Epulopiscium sp. Nuni2H_MBin001]OON91932.1 MAG: hypothetical protein ATN34_04625 [Epulopiscium sp. Nele67-Bin002]